MLYSPVDSFQIEGTTSSSVLATPAKRWCHFPNTINKYATADSYWASSSHMPITEPIIVARGYIVLITQDCLMYSSSLLKRQDGVSPTALHGLRMEEM